MLREWSRLGRVRSRRCCSSATARRATPSCEESAAVLSETDLTGARTFGEQVRRLVADQPFEYEGDKFPVTVSGVVCVEGEDIDVTSFIKTADDHRRSATPPLICIAPSARVVTASSAERVATAGHACVLHDEVCPDHWRGVRRDGVGSSSGPDDHAYIAPSARVVTASSTDPAHLIRVLREWSCVGRVRREELLVRYGGEEFAAVLSETDLTGARTFGEQVRRLVADQPFEYEGDTFPVTVSVGVACVEGEDIDVTSFKTADDHLYRAKREGRNRVIG